MSRPASPVVQRKQLANRLRRLRGEAGLTLEQAAVAIEASPATLSRIENGIRIPQTRDVRDLCSIYGLADPVQVAELMELAGAARESGWWESYSEVDDDYATYIGLEAASTTMQQYEGLYVPAMLQTPGYARAFFADAVSPSRVTALNEQDIARRIEIRTKRQALLESGTGFTYSVVLDEAVLLRPVGGSDVMREQLTKLLAMTELPVVNLQIVPLARGAHPGQQGGFTILALPKDVSDIVYVDTLAGQLFLESSAELARHRRVFDALKELSYGEVESKEALIHILAGLDEGRVNLRTPSGTRDI